MCIFTTSVLINIDEDNVNLLLIFMFYNKHTTQIVDEIFWNWKVNSFKCNTYMRLYPFGWLMLCLFESWLHNVLSLIFFAVSLYSVLKKPSKTFKIETKKGNNRCNERPKKYFLNLSSSCLLIAYSLYKKYFWNRLIKLSIVIAWRSG